MIHSFKLPLSTCYRLRDIVRLQMNLLHYAAFHAEFDTGDTLLKESCVAYFASQNIQHDDFQGRGEGIARWLWNGRASTRYENLKNFALACRNASEQRETIRSWYHRLDSEVKELLDPANRTVHIQRFFETDPPPSNKGQKNETPQWQQQASNFLLYFYEGYLGKEWPDI